MDKSFGVLERAISKSFDRAAGTDDTQVRDEDLKLYETLTPEALSVIADTYGTDKLMEYVTAMEVRRQQKGQ